ncbi:heme/copper-type cytochrome/quinol oxidase subunit 2 [Cytobacillus purgationiresistens]|uniref:Heme/copper-type cytochrome/quinol oxidase subunit 2 n=1 Tax=Cytobacillus purgationiresistens TaxID=863449 RepID=A0ABU0ARG4_9BACI|nr:heme/copper-type cytochrome/quinol oxidase subunit 2 [Cytobacillus purgationiresistens]
MWDLYVKYALPILILVIIGTSILRVIRKYKNTDKHNEKSKIVKSLVISLIITFLFISITTMILINNVLK